MDELKDLIISSTLKDEATSFYLDGSLVINNWISNYDSPFDH